MGLLYLYLPVDTVALVPNYWQPLSKLCTVAVKYSSAFVLFIRYQSSVFPSILDGCEQVLQAIFGM